MNDSNPNTETKEAMLERVLSENATLKRKIGDLEWSRDLYEAGERSANQALDAEVSAHNATMEISTMALEVATAKINSLRSKLQASDAYVLSLLQK